MHALGDEGIIDSDDIDLVDALLFELRIRFNIRRYMSVARSRESARDANLLR